MRKPRRHASRLLRAGLLAAAVVAVLGGAFSSSEAATNGRVLIVGPTVWPGVVPDPVAPRGGGEVSGGTTPGVSVEQAEAELLGEDVDVVDAVAFASMTTKQISQYDALVMGDPGCGVSKAPSVVLRTRSVWGPAVTGNVIIIGAAPVYAHVGTGARDWRPPLLVDAGLAFATGDPKHTGAYIDLSCYYAHARPARRIDLLEPLGNFTARGVCASATHLLLGKSPRMPFQQLSNYVLSNWWRCSAYEAFESYPPTFTPIATVGGRPYILTRRSPGA
jgi:hypothetical protein